MQNTVSSVLQMQFWNLLHYIYHDIKIVSFILMNIGDIFRENLR